jgi:hypothetical protein
MSDHNPMGPPKTPAAQTVEERLIRMETRLVRLMQHIGLDADGNPKDQKDQKDGPRTVHTPKSS